MKAIFLLLISITNAKPLFFTLTKADTNYIILTKTPAYGAVVYRDGKKITQEPVKPLQDPSKVQEILGEDYENILEVTGSLDDYQLLRKLKHSHFQAGILSLTNLKVAKLLGRVVKDYPVERGRKYTYRVVFLRFNGEESKTQDKKTHVTQEKLPTPPEKIKATAGDKSVTVRWKFREWEPGDLVVSFNVYRRLKGDTVFTKVNTRPIVRLNSGNMEFTDQWLKNGVTYEYGISSVDLIGRESKLSKLVSVTPIDKTPPSPPAGLIVIDGGGKAVLRWNFSLELDVAGYNVFRSNNIGENYTKLNKKTIPFSTPMFVDTEVPAGRFFYSVSAIDSSGNESKRSNPIMVIIKDSIPPDPPSNVRAVYRDKKIVVTWDASHANDLLGYYVHRGTIKDKLPKINSRPLPPDTRKFVDKGYGGGGFSSGYTYFVGVTAIDSSRNESEIIKVAVTIPDSEPPAPPTLITVKSTKEGFARINFTPSPSLDVKSYTVLRDGKPIVTLVRTRTVYVDSGVKVGKKYRYSVAAVDTAGNMSKEIRSESILITDRVPPDAPSKVTANYGDDGVELNWIKSKADDVVGYNIYRSDLPNGKYMKVNSKIVKSEKFVDRNGKKYHFYRVSAVDASGNEKLAPYVRPGSKK